jgi:hypothetical protein
MYKFTRSRRCRPKQPDSDIFANQRSNWNDNRDCLNGTGITYSIDGSTYTNIHSLEYLLMLLQHYFVTKKNAAVSLPN